MTLAELKADILRVIYVERIETAPDYILEAVKSAINEAYQWIWLSPETYFREVETVINVASGVSKTTLSDVVEVAGPLMQGDRQLVALGNEGENTMAPKLYVGADGVGRPRYYYVRRNRQDTASAVSVVLEVHPVPDANYEVLANLIPAAPSFTYAEILTSTADLQIPHEYAETLLQPIARKCITRCHWFQNTEILPLIEADYKVALAALRLADPYRTQEKPETAAQGGDA